jgi:hypothetical protein
LPIRHSRVPPIAGIIIGLGGWLIALALSQLGVPDRLAWLAFGIGCVFVIAGALWWVHESMARGQETTEPLVSAMSPVSAERAAAYQAIQPAIRCVLKQMTAQHEQLAYVMDPVADPDAAEIHWLTPDVSPHEITRARDDINSYGSKGMRDLVGEFFELHREFQGQHHILQLSGGPSGTTHETISELTRIGADAFVKWRAIRQQLRDET